MEFEWDAEKNEANLKKHGISFDQASRVFADSLSRTFRDPDHSQDEERFVTIGSSGTEWIVVVSHTDREDRIRIISARRATPAERRRYEQ